MGDREPGLRFLDLSQVGLGMREYRDLVAALIRLYQDAVYAVDEAGRIIAASPSFELLTGFASGELAGRARVDVESGMTAQGTIFRRKDGACFVAARAEEAISAGPARFRFCRVSGAAVEERMPLSANDSWRSAAPRDLVTSLSHRLNNGLEGVVAVLQEAREAKDARGLGACLDTALQRIGACRDGVIEILKRVPGYRDAQHESDVLRPGESAPAGKLRVLVAEDDAPIRALVAKLLERAGHFVTQAKDGNEALHHASAVQFGLMVTDFAMPGPGPVELIRRLRTAQPRVPLAVMSGQLFSKEEKEELRGAGADAFLAKPFRIEEFQKLIETLIGAGPQRGGREDGTRGPNPGAH